MYVRIFDQSDSGALNHSEVGMLIGMGMPSATEEEVAEYADFLFEKVLLIMPSRQVFSYASLLCYRWMRMDQEH